MAVELYKYMQVVDDKARQLDDAAAASSPGVRRELNTSEGSVDGAGEPADDGGVGFFVPSRLSSIPQRLCLSWVHVELPPVSITMNALSHGFGVG